MSDKEKLIPAELITQHHHYSGLVRAEGRRLADCLADRGFDVLEMNHVTLNTIGASATERKLDKALIRKDHVVLGIPTGSYEAPIKRSNNFQRKGQHDATIVLAGHVLSCVVYMPKYFKPWAVIDEKSDLPTFVGVTDVTFLSSSHGLLPEKCNTAIIRRGAVESMEVAAISLPSGPTGAPADTSDMLQAIRELRGAT